MNNLQLKALRQGLGLTVADAAELVGVTKRSFQYWEDGSRQIPNDLSLHFSIMQSHFSMIFYFMVEDIAKATIYNDPDDDTKPMTVTPAMPFFLKFEDFVKATDCQHIVYWRIYQSVTSQLLLAGKISKLNDDAKIPKNFRIWKWFGGNYEHQDSIS